MPRVAWHFCEQACHTPPGALASEWPAKDKLSGVDTEVLHDRFGPM